MRYEKTSSCFQSNYKTISTIPEKWFKKELRAGRRQRIVKKLMHDVTSIRNLGSQK